VKNNSIILFLVVLFLYSTQLSGNELGMYIKYGQNNWLNMDNTGMFITVGNSLVLQDKLGLQILTTFHYNSIYVMKEPEKWLDYVDLSSSGQIPGGTDIYEDNYSFGLGIIGTYNIKLFSKLNIYGGLGPMVYIWQWNAYLPV